MRLRSRQVTGRKKRKTVPSRKLREANESTKKRSKKTTTKTIKSSTKTKIIQPKVPKWEERTPDPPRGTILKVIENHYADVPGELEARQGDIIEVLGPSEFSGRVRAKIINRSTQNDTGRKKTSRRTGIIQVESFLENIPSSGDESENESDSANDSEHESANESEHQSDDSKKESFHDHKQVLVVKDSRPPKRIITPPRPPKRKVAEVTINKETDIAMAPPALKVQRMNIQQLTSKKEDSLPSVSVSVMDPLASTSSSSTSTSTSTSNPTSIHSPNLESIKLLRLGGKIIYPKELGQVVKNIGGYPYVKQNRKWQDVRRSLGLPEMSSSGHQINKAYLTYFGPQAGSSSTNAHVSATGSAVAISQTTRSALSRRRFQSFIATSHICVAESTESKQTRIRPLAPVVYRPPLRMQDSTRITIENATRCARNVLSSFLPVVNMRVNYRTNTLYLVGNVEERATLLNKTFDADVRIRTLKSVIDEIQDGDFVILHYLLYGGSSSSNSSSNNTTTKLFKIIPSVKRTESNCQICFRCKKGVAGTGGMVSTDGRKLYTLVIQIDLYISRNVWSTLNKQEQLFCGTFVKEYERSVNAMSQHRNSNGQGWKLHYSSTRNTFDHKLVTVETPMESKATSIKTQYYFDTNVPVQYDINKHSSTAVMVASSTSSSSSSSSSSPSPSSSSSFMSTSTTSSSSSSSLSLSSTRHPVGVTSLHNIFTEQELIDIESNVVQLSMDRAKGKLRPQTYHTSHRRHSSPDDLPTRTKFFFGSRYLWGGTNRDPLPNVAAGIRTCDVDGTRPWMRKIEQHLVDLGIVQPFFVNQFAVNIYHSGTEGLAQHYDDAKRFKQPIISLRLFSDSRLSFGSKYYYYHDSSFFIPMERGAITIMEPSSFAANDISHCVRPSDMEGRSAVIVLRHVKQERIQESTMLAIDRMSNHFGAFNLIRNQPFIPIAEDHKTKRTTQIIQSQLSKIISKIVSLHAKEKRSETRELKRVIDTLMDGVVAVNGCYKTDLILQIGKIQLHRQSQTKSKRQRIE